MDWFLKVCAVCACLQIYADATPPPGYVKQPETDAHPPKYEFGYDLKDGYGGSQGHLETRDGEFALGKYYVNLPNNEQKVDYFADDWGFHPLVAYKTSSGTSSMSTQFALGEKAVAALSRQYGVAPPLEILKTKVANSIVAGGPQVLVQGSSGLIPGPSDEPVHNSLEAESYSTTSAPPSEHYSVTPSSQIYQSTPSVSAQHVSGGVEVSTVSPAQAAYSGVSSTQYESNQEGFYRGNFESQKQASISGSQYSGYSSTENSPVPSSGFGNSESEYQSQSQSYETASGSAGYSTPSPSSSGLSYSSPTVSSQGYHESSTVANEHSDHQVTSYLADTNSAIDVTNTGLTQVLPGVRDYSPNTRISAVLVGEGESHYEDNEIRQEYVSSTTPSPPKSFKPIVVSDTGLNPSTLAIFHSNVASSTERYRSGKIGKLYHREGTVDSGYSTHQPEVTSNSLPSVGYDYQSTPAPTPEPVLVTPRVHPALLTSSGNILAPIRAGVSISNGHDEEDCDEKPVKEDESSEPVIEKQEVREEAHYKTTVDIQKSIPFEIHPNEEVSQEYSYETKGHTSQTGFEGVKEDYHTESTAEVTDGDYKKYSNEGYSQQQNPGDVVANGHTGQTDYLSQENNGASYQQQQEYHHQESGDRQVPVAYNQNQYNQNFLQQVAYAYHRLANSHAQQEAQNNPSYSVNAPAYNQPVYVPNRLYYVYLQRYNPYVNRYGSQSPTYGNYQGTTSPGAQYTTAGYNYGQEGLSHGSGGNGQAYAQEYKGQDSYNSQEQVGYSSYVNHESAGVGVASSYSQHNSDESKYNSKVPSNENSNGVEHFQSLSPTPYSVTSSYESSNQASQEYASQLNAVNSAQGVSVHPDNQHVQYLSTSHGAESAALTQENYNEEQSIQHENGNERHQDKYAEEASNEVHHNANVLIKEVPVPQYIEKTKYVEIEKPIHIPHPYPVEYTKVVEKPVPVPHPVPVPQTQIVEKHVPVPQPVPVEVTRVVEKHVPVPHPVPVEYTKVVAVEKPVPVPQPVPYAVTKLVAVDRPVAYPHPVPVPYAVPHPVGVPVPHLVPYPHVVPVPVKDYRPVYIYRKSTGGRLLHREFPHAKYGKSSPAFRPSQPVFNSQYPPPSYHVTTYFKSPHGKSRGQPRKLCIEYGGFKPPLIPSVQVDEDPKTTYGPAEQKH
ncbi:uncharacterized protein LOC129000688 [Macrosteles quadrilineatus]|uniref:uncharacterized protein LOC129000688 n=1 Tax=Macrosteles quadrilineatus TaxID=74068 RepID=UPI0023E17C96|nr:uncharacterized protein LOC129000688 [Macrosteles quadrilineatus]